MLAWVRLSPRSVFPIKQYQYLYWKCCITHTALAAKLGFSLALCTRPCLLHQHSPRDKVVFHVCLFQTLQCSFTCLPWRAQAGNRGTLFAMEGDKKRLIQLSCGCCCCLGRWWQTQGFGGVTYGEGVWFWNTSMKSCGEMGFAINSCTSLGHCDLSVCLAILINAATEHVA